MITDPENINLKPCPFCGKPAYFSTVTYTDAAVQEQQWGQKTFLFVSCGGCQSNNKGLVGHRTKPEAATHWNQRQPEHQELKPIGVCVEIGDGPDGTPRVIITSGKATLQSIAGNLLYKTVAILPLDQ